MTADKLTREATDAEIECVRNHTLCQVSKDVAIRILNRLAASERELADLRAKLTPTQSDRDLAVQFIPWRGGSSVVHECEIDSATEKIAAHVAPLRAQLDQAVGHLSHCVQMIQWMSGSNDFSPDGQAHQGWLRMYPDYEEARQFLAEHPRQGATIPTAEGENES